MTVLFLELGEQWRYPLFTSAVLLLIILITWIGITRMLLLRRFGSVNHLAPDVTS
jgi:hypothetical protein